VMLLLKITGSAFKKRNGEYARMVGEIFLA